MRQKSHVAAGDRPRTTLMSLQEASYELGISYWSLRDLVLKKHLPRVQLGDSRRIWVKRTDLAKFLADSTERGPLKSADAV